MSDKRENIRITNIDSFFLILIFILGFLIYHNTNDNISVRNKKSVATETSLSQKSTGILIPGIKLQAFHKIRISDKSNFKLLSCARIQFLENKRTIQVLSLLQITRNKSEWIPVKIFRHNLFQIERDEIPLLS